MTDEQLAGAAQTGDTAAADTLVGRYERAAHWLARDYFLPGGERDDVAQEAMLALFLAVRGFDPANTTSFRAFAFVVMRRRLASAVKMANRPRHLALAHAARTGVGADGERIALVDALPATTCDPHQALEQQEEIRALLRGLPGLSRFERVALAGWLNDVTYADIAASEGRTAKSVDTALQRAKRKLRAAA